MCVRVFVFVWTMTVSVVPEELMSRWSEWDSAYSLSLLFTLALISLSASVSVCLLGPSHSLPAFLVLFFVTCESSWGGSAYRTGSAGSNATYFCCFLLFFKYLYYSALALKMVIYLFWKFRHLRCIFDVSDE